jgi:hypothetical protein
VRGIAKVHLGCLDAEPLGPETAGKIATDGCEIIAITMKYSPVPILNVVAETPELA